MATVVSEPGESGSKRRRRRTRRDAQAASEAEPAVQTGGNGSNGVHDSSATHESNGAPREVEASSLAVAEPVVTGPPSAPAPTPDTDVFRDLLGQAVGLRLDAVSREFGGRDEMHVTALRNVTLDIGPGE
ncbi:MAG TPA: hypothetical protein VI172_11985, partial [Candidatus Dormibacteraeota bacterium]